MKKTNLNNLLGYLFEQTPEAPKDALYGQYLFAPQRSGLPHEENTYEEEDFFLDLYNHYHSGKKTLDKWSKPIKNLVDKGYYLNLLKAPKGNVYRFLSGVSVSRAAKILRLSKKEINEKPNRAWYVEGGGFINPQDGKTQSWTTKLASSWIKDGINPEWIDQYHVSMILVAKTNNNFFLNPKKIREIEDLPEVVHKENEVVSFGPVEFFEAAYIIGSKNKREDFDSYFPKLMKALGL